MKNHVATNWKRACSRLALLLCAFASSLFTLPAATVTGTIVDTTGTALVTTVVFQPLSNPQVDGGIVITAGSKSVTTTAGGTFSVTLEQGDYTVLIRGRDQFTIAVPNDSTTNNVTALTTDGLTYTYQPIASLYPYATAAINGGVKTDVTEADPLVYTAATVDTLIAGVATNTSVLTAITNQVTSVATTLVGGKLDITNGTAVNLTVDGAKPVIYVANVAAMQALTNLTSGQVVQTAGRTLAGYGGAQYLWTSGTTNTTNLGTVFANSGGGDGRFTLIDPNPGDIRFWGAISGGPDCSVAIQAAINALSATTFGGLQKPHIFIPVGQWYITNTITVTGTPLHIQGEGIELGSVDTESYLINGSTLFANFTTDKPMIELVGITNGGGATYLQGIDITDIAFDQYYGGGATYGIQFTATSNTSGMSVQRCRFRWMKYSGIRSGGGTLATSPRWGYSRFTDLSFIFNGRDGLEFYCSDFNSVDMVFSNLYANGNGRHSFNFYNVSFIGSNFVENNAAQLEPGYGLYLRNTDGTRISGVYLEGDGRYQASGASGKPLFNAAAAKIMGVTDTTINGLQVFSPTGNGTSASGAVEIGTSAGDNGWSVRGSAGLAFNSPNLVGLASTVAAPTASAAGSSGSLSSGVYRYAVTQVMTNTGAGTTWETPISASGHAIVNVTALNTVSLSAMVTNNSIAGSPQFTAVIYRTAANGATFYPVATNTPGNPAYSDTMSDATLTARTAKADFHLVYISSDTGNTYWNNVTANVEPRISDLSGRMRVNGIYVKTIDPATQVWPGTMTFNGTVGSVHGGANHIFGADAVGYYQDIGVTANLDKRMRLHMPRYDASRPEVNYPIQLLSGYSTNAGGARVVIGGASSVSYSPVEVVLAPGNGSQNTSTEVLSATTSKIASAVDVQLANAKYLTALDLGGTSKNLVGMTAGSIMQVGPGSGTTRLNILPGTDGLYLGQKGLSAAIWLPPQDSATVGAQLKNSQTLGLGANYWNGSAATDYYATVQYIMDSTGPTASLYWNLGGANVMRLQNTGTLTVSNLTATLAATVAGNPVLAYTGTPTTGQIAVYTNSAWTVMTPGSSGIGGSTGSTDNRVLRADGTGGATVQNSAISVSDVTAYSSQDYVQVSAIGSGTKTGLVLKPEGTGAFILGSPPDGTATGGNNRGARAVDLQLTRSSAAYVASGADSFAVNVNNTASGDNSFASGWFSSASGVRSIAGGYASTASGNDAFAFGSQSSASALYSIAFGYQAAASSGYAAMSFGYQTTATGQGAHATGQSTTASADQSSAGGLSSKAYLLGMDARASGTHAAQGDSQAIQLTWRNATSSTTPTELYLNGSTATLRAAMPNNSAWSGRVILQGTTAAGAAVNSYAFDVVIKRGANAAATTLKVATKTVVYEDDAGADSNLTADTTNGSLKVEVTAANATATRWSATGYFTETGFP